MKKRKIIVCLLAALVVLSLAGCNKTAKSKDSVSSEDVVELTFWAHYETGWNDSYRDIAASFTEENPNIHIKFEFFPYDDFEAKIQTSLIAKSAGADLYELWGGWAIDYAPTGALSAMPDELANRILADSYPSTYGSLKYNGKVYGVPMEFNIECGGMLVNLNLLHQNGLTIPETWDELISEARAGTVTDGDQFVVRGFDFVNWDSVTYILTSMILTMGGQYLNDDGTVNFSSDQAKTAFASLTDLVLKDHVTDLYGLTDNGDMEGYQLLFANSALFVPRGPWPISEGVDTFELTYDTDFTYAPLPWYGENVSFAAETGWSLAVNGASDHKEAAYKFLDYFYQDDILLQHNINCSMIPPKKSVAQNSVLLDKMPYASVLVGILDKGQYIGNFNTDVFKEAINNTFVDYCTGMYGSIDEALSSLESTLNSNL